MATHETFTDNPGLATLLGPARVGLPGTWFGSVSIWSGQIIGFTPAGNPVVEVSVSGVPGVSSVQAEVFGVRTYDATGLASVNVTMIEWSLPGSATILARYTFDSAVVFPLSISRFEGILQFVDILANGPTPQQLFDDYFQNADTLIGGNAAEIMDGGGNNDILDGGGGADTLYGGDGNDDFVYRTGDAVAGESIYGGTGTDALLAIGALVNGDVLQAGGVDVSAININSVEEIHVNGTEVVINSGQLVAAGFQTFVGRTGFADQLTIGNVSSGDLSTLNMVNWEAGVDTIAVLGTTGADNVHGSSGDDTFIGQLGADIFDGAGGDDRFLIMSNELNPFDQFAGGIGIDVLQIDSVAITSVQITPVTNLRDMTLSSVETLDIVQGSFAMDATDFIGSISGTVTAPVLTTTGFNRIIGNGNGLSPNIVLLEVHVGNQLGIDMRNIVFENWNDGFYIDKTIRIVAGAQTRLIMCANEETWVNGSASTAGIYVLGGNQADEVYGSFQKDFILAGSGDDYIVALNGDDVVDGGEGSDTVWAGDGADSVVGSAGTDFLYGEVGDDRLFGGADNDVLNGGAGSDSLAGGLGADQHIGGDDGGIDYARYDDANHGNLTIRLDNSALNVGAAALGDTYTGIEGLVGGVGNDTIVGNSATNYLHGSGGNDSLNGLDGIDYLYGGDGDDTYVLGAGADIVNDTAGIDTITTSISRDLTSYANIEYLRLLGTDNINGTGNSLANRIMGNSGKNVLNGGTDNVVDRLFGGDGDDTYVLGTGNDVVSDTAGIDTITSAITRNLTSYAAIENLRLLGADNINGTGNALANRITGNSGNNFIDGMLGSDILVGGAGNDSFVFTTALSPTNIDRITDYNVANDTIRIDNAVFTALGIGNLSALAFASNTTGLAGDATDRIVYESDTGRLFYDADGLGGAAGIHFATLAAGLALTQADFVVF